MVPFHEHLREYLNSLDAGVFRLVKNGDELIEEISDKLDCNVVELRKSFHEFNRTLEQPAFISGWSVRHSQDKAAKYIDRTMVFDRLLHADSIERITEVNTNFIRKDLEKKIQKLTPEQFEIFCYHFLDELGSFEDIQQGPPGKDGGIDLRGTILYHGERPKLLDLEEKETKYKFVAQVKKQTGKIGRPLIDKLIGVMNYPENKGCKGIFISSSDFAPGSISTAKKNGIVLFAINKQETDDGRVIGIFDMMIENEIGVTRRDFTVSSPNAWWRELGFED